MKKIIYILIFILVLSSCSLWKDNLLSDKCLIEYKIQDWMWKVLLDFWKVNNCNNNRTVISWNEAKVKINDDFTLNFIDGASFNINKNKFYIIKRNSEIDKFISSIKKWARLVWLYYWESMLDVWWKSYEDSNTYKLTMKVATLDNEKSKYMLVLWFKKFIIITFIDVEEQNYEWAYEPDYWDEDSLNMKELDIINLFKKVDDLIPDEIVKNEVNNSNLSEDNLLNNWYKLNRLWDVKEYYNTIILNKNNWVYRNQTIYKKWNKILKFWITYAQWPQLEITYPIHKYINLDELDVLKDESDLYKVWFWYNIWQPILWKYDYKVIVNKNLDEIRIVNKDKWINKVIWKE